MLERYLSRCLLCLACFCGAVSASSAQEALQEENAAIHQELRAIITTVEEAINSQNFDRMLPIMSEQIRATPINQEFLQNRKEISAYFQKWFGESGYLRSLEFHLTADALTELSVDKTWGVVYGKGVERYVLRDGRPYDLETRWTATVAKESDDKWRIRAIHIGTNFLDNALLNEIENGVKYVGIGSAAVGLILGGLLGWFLGRRKKKG
jgi:ketosteroid isomerase-like protein